ncbi:MAG: hypothetical protein R3A47_00695 [Polyangiales bacterium]
MHSVGAQYGIRFSLFIESDARLRVVDDSLAQIVGRFGGREQAFSLDAPRIEYATSHGKTWQNFASELAKLRPA